MSEATSPVRDTPTYERAEQTADALAAELDAMAAVVREKIAVGEAGEKLAREFSRPAHPPGAAASGGHVQGPGDGGVQTREVHVPRRELLGRRVLPAKAAPCTAIVTVIRYGEEPAARVVFDDGRPEESLPFDEFKRRYELTVEDAADKAVVTDRFSRIEHAVVSYPLELCRHRVELIDSPGLGEHATRTRRTERFLPQADAVVLVLSAAQLLSEEELHFLNNVLLPLGLRNIFFVVNFWNTVENPDKEPEEIERDRRDLDARIRQHLSKFTATGDGRDLSAERVFRVNALRHAPGPAEGPAGGARSLRRSRDGAVAAAVPRRGPGAGAERKRAGRRGDRAGRGRPVHRRRNWRWPGSRSSRSRPSSGSSSPSSNSSARSAATS